MRGIAAIRARVPLAQLAALERADAPRMVAAGKTVPLEIRRISALVDAASQTREVVLSSAAPLAPGLAGELRWQAGRPHLPPEFLQTREGRLGAFVVEQGQPVFRAVDGAQAGRPAAVDWAVDTPVVDGGRLGIGLEGSRPR